MPPDLGSNPHTTPSARQWQQTADSGDRGEPTAAVRQAAGAEMARPGGLRRRPQSTTRGIRKRACRCRRRGQPSPPGEGRPKADKIRTGLAVQPRWIDGSLRGCASGRHSRGRRDVPQDTCVNRGESPLCRPRITPRGALVRLRRSRRQESSTCNPGHCWPRDTLVPRGCYRHNKPIRPSLRQATGCRSLR